MTRKEMHRHVMDLLERYNIIYSWCRRPTEARAVSYAAGEEFDEVWITPIRSAISYATALHEIGHILGCHQRSPDTLVRERWAWPLGKRECADLDARHGEELQRLLGLVRSAAGALVVIGKATDRLSKAALNKATEYSDRIIAWMNARSTVGDRRGARARGDEQPPPPLGSSRSAPR